MATIDETKLLGKLNKVLKPLGTALHKQLVKAGCTTYVKTIYIGYDLNGIMVAALYPHIDRVEIALALPDSHESGLFIDATHLTWKTLPVAVVLNNEEDLAEASVLVEEACQRIKDGVHDVERPNDYFMKSRREDTLGAHRPQR